MAEDSSLEARLQRLERQLAEQDPARNEWMASRMDRLIRFAPLLLISHLLVGLPTLLISLVVAYGTFVQADATQKIQQAEAWPFLSYGTSNIGQDGQPSISLELHNNGVGPALLGPIEISYEGRPVKDPRDMLERCCGLKADERISIQTSPASRIALPAGDSALFMRIAATAENRAIWDRFETERWKLRVRSCYCSIFDECWMIEGTQARPRAVKQCPTDWAAYSERRETAPTAR